MTIRSTTKRAMMAGMACAALAATPAAAVSTITFNFGSATGTNTTATSKVASDTGRTLTATARKFNVAPGTLTNLSQTRTANAAANSPTYLLRLTAPGIGVNGGASDPQLDTNSAGTANSPLREGILFTSNVSNFSLTGLKLSFVDADDTLQVYGVNGDGSFVNLNYGGVIRATAGSSLAGAATGVNTAANSATTVLTLTNPTANFSRYFFTTRIGGDVSFMGTTGQGYRIDSITGVVPEPGTWAMLIIGFGLVGLSSRRRVSRVVA